MLKTEAAGRGFQHLTRDLADINAWKIMFDPYIEIIYSESVFLRMFMELSLEIDLMSDRFCFSMILFTREIFDLKVIEDIYFIELNIRYISSNVLKISVISRVHSTSEIANIFRT